MDKLMARVREHVLHLQSEGKETTTFVVLKHLTSTGGPLIGPILEQANAASLPHLLRMQGASYGLGMSPSGDTITAFDVGSGAGTGAATTPAADSGSEQGKGSGGVSSSGPPALSANELIGAFLARVAYLLRLGKHFSVDTRFRLSTLGTQNDYTTLRDALRPKRIIKLRRIIESQQGKALGIITAGLGGDVGAYVIQESAAGLLEAPTMRAVVSGRAKPLASRTKGGGSVGDAGPAGTTRTTSTGASGGAGSTAKGSLPSTAAVDAAAAAGGDVSALRRNYTIEDRLNRYRFVQTMHDMRIVESALGKEDVFALAAEGSLTAEGRYDVLHLVQLYLPRVQKTYFIHPVSWKDGGVDRMWSALKPLLEQARLIVVMHNAPRLCEALWRLQGIDVGAERAAPVFRVIDVQIALARVGNQQAFGTLDAAVRHCGLRLPAPPSARVQFNTVMSPASRQAALRHVILLVDIANSLFSDTQRVLRARVMAESLAATRAWVAEVELPYQRDFVFSFDDLNRVSFLESPAPVCASAAGLECLYSLVRQEEEVAVLSMLTALPDVVASAIAEQYVQSAAAGFRFVLVDVILDVGQPVRIIYHAAGISSARLDVVCTPALLAQAFVKLGVLQRHTDAGGFVPLAYHLTPTGAILPAAAAPAGDAGDAAAGAGGGAGDVDGGDATGDSGETESEAATETETAAQAEAKAETASESESEAGGGQGEAGVGGQGKAEEEEEEEEEAKKKKKEEKEEEGGGELWSSADVAFFKSCGVAVPDAIAITNAVRSVAQGSYEASGLAPWFGADRQGGLAGTLHRFSWFPLRRGGVGGLTCHVGRVVREAADIIHDLLEQLSTRGESMLLLGPSSSGVTTLLRTVAGLLAFVRGAGVVVVDATGDVGGGGGAGGPHPVLGDARCVVVPEGGTLATTLHRVVDQHAPRVVVVEGVATAADVAAVRYAMRRGVAVVAAPSAATLADVVCTPELAPLVGVSSSGEAPDVSPFHMVVEWRINKRVAVVHDQVALAVRSVLQHGHVDPVVFRLSSHVRWIGDAGMMVRYGADLDVVCAV